MNKKKKVDSWLTFMIFPKKKKKGHGEKDEEIRQAFRDLLNIGVDCVTLGQYLQPTKKHKKVDGNFFFVFGKWIHCFF